MPETVDGQSICESYSQYKEDEFQSNIPVGISPNLSDTDRSSDEQPQRPYGHIDLYQSQPESEALIACSERLNYSLFGQLYTSARLFDHDREFLRQQFEAGSDLAADGTTIDSVHRSSVDQRQIKKPVEDFNLRVAVTALHDEAGPLVRASEYLDVTVELLDDKWNEVTSDQPAWTLNSAPDHAVDPTERDLTTSIANRSQVLQSDEKRSMLLGLSLDHSQTSIYPSVRVSRDSMGGSSTTPIRADAVAVASDASEVYVIEFRKHGTSPDAAYAHGVGHALAKAGLFELEFGVSATPIVVFDSVPRIGQYLQQGLPAAIEWDSLWPAVISVNRRGNSFISTVRRSFEN
ncbi:hypothetical protein RYH80_19720 [Halobaculum sp. MBLA0147]|uniref:hypothetical protein n=1 Tax=Halobaculum sp. MBLA0147 TaxID=3079934 RepID=UPI003526BF69